MKFFTDKTVKNDFLLIKIKDYIKMKESTKNKWKEILVDPGVYDLTKDYKFKWEGKINIHEFLNTLSSNHFFSCDLPSDMNLKYKKYFLEKSWQYAKAYSYHPQYIVTVQFYHNNYLNFIEWFNKYNNLEIKSEILGIGNYCKHHFTNEFIKHTLPYIFKNCKHPRIHIYGLALRNIRWAYKLSKKYGIGLSIDSTKWTRVVNKELRERMGEGHRGCNANERQLFFDEYLKEITKRGVLLDNE